MSVVMWSQRQCSSPIQVKGLNRSVFLPYTLHAHVSSLHPFYGRQRLLEGGEKKTSVCLFLDTTEFSNWFNFYKLQFSKWKAQNKIQLMCSFFDEMFIVAAFTETGSQPSLSPSVQSECGSFPQMSLSTHSCQRSSCHLFIQSSTFLEVCFSFPPCS